MAQADVELKRPPSAYWLWCTENRPSVVKALGGVTKGSEVSKKAGEMWKALGDGDKAPYEAKAKALREEYDAKKPQKKERAPGVEVRKKPMVPVFAFIQEKREEIQKMPGIKSLGE